MIYNKHFFIGLALVLGGLGIAAFWVVQSGIGPQISFTESFAGKNNCTQLVCREKEGCAMDDNNQPMFVFNETLFYKGPAQFTGDLDDDQPYPISAFTEAGFEPSFARCPKPKYCPFGEGGPSDNPIGARIWADFCLSSQYATPTPKPTPKVTKTPKPTATPQHEIIKACTGYKCWWNVYKTIKALGTPEDPVFVDETATMNLFLVNMDDAAFLSFIEKRPHEPSSPPPQQGSTEARICFMTPTGNPPPKDYKMECVPPL